MESFFNILINLWYFPSSVFCTNLYGNGGGGPGMGTTFWVISISFSVALSDSPVTSISSSSLVSSSDHCRHCLKNPRLIIPCISILFIVAFLNRWWWIPSQIIHIIDLFGTSTHILQHQPQFGPHLSHILTNVISILFRCRFNCKCAPPNV